MKKIIKLSLIAGALLACYTVNATGFCGNESRWAVQGVLASGGNLGFGVVNYGPKYEIGATLSGSVIKTNNRDASIVTPVLFAGLRQPIAENTNFAYGLDADMEFGKMGALTLDTSYGLAPYVSLEYQLNNNVLLSGWIEPYKYHYTEYSNNSTVTTHSFFNTGGIGINYLFG